MVEKMSGETHARTQTQSTPQSPSSDMKFVYLLLCLLGTALPYAAFGPWLAQHGLAFHLLAQQVMATPVAAFAWADVLVSAMTLLVFISHQQRQTPVKHVWLPVAGLLCVGVSLALPLYLYLRERAAAKH